MKLFSWPAKAFAFLIYSLPYSMQKAVGNLLGFLWFDLFRIRRDIIDNNLKIAFPQMTAEERIRIGRESCRNLGMTFVEFCRFPFVHPNDRAKFEFKGLENIRAALAQGKGVCLLTLHIGNLDWATVGCAFEKVPLTIISKEFKIKWLNDLWFGMRRKFGTKFIAPRNSSIAILRSLKANEIVCFVLDQYMGPPIGVKTKVFGVETGTAMGLSVLAGRSRSPVIPAYTCRRADGTTYIQFDPEIPFVESANKEETIRDMTQVYSDKLEEYIRECPEQWMWVHRRWKKFVDKKPDSASP